MSENQNSKAVSDGSRPNSRETVETVLLAQVLDRLHSLELKVGQEIDSRPTKPSIILELLKSVLGGWPALMLVFLILFYNPLYDALKAIPEKVRAADEIGLPGFSLKSSIEREASKSGIGELADALPYLSPRAIQFLLKAEKNAQSSLVSYSTNDVGQIDTLWFPSEKELSVIKELVETDLAFIKNGLGANEIQGVSAVKAQISDFKKQHPGEALPTFTDYNGGRWKLDTPISEDVYHEINAQWGTTDLGNQAIDVIIRAVASAIEPNGDEEQLIK